MHFDDVSGSIGGVAYVAPTNSPSGAALYITAPKTAPLNKQSPNGPGAITTVDATGAVLATQYVPKVLPGPAGCTNNWGDGSATQYKTNMSSYVVADTVVSTCATPIGQVGESTAPGINVVDASSVVGTGDRCARVCKLHAEGLDPVGCLHRFRWLAQADVHEHQRSLTASVGWSRIDTVAHPCGGRS